MYKAVIFDFFGVLCSDIGLRWLIKTLPNAQALRVDFQKICDRSDRGELSKLAFIKEVAALTGYEAKDVKRGIEGEITINKPLVDLARFLKLNYEIGVLTNTSIGWIDSILEEYKIGDCFDEIVISAAVGMVKPDKDIFDFTLKKLGVKPSEAIFVDDRQMNITAAESYGITSILFTDNESLKKDMISLGFSI